MKQKTSLELPDPFVTVPADESPISPIELRTHYLGRALRGYASIRRALVTGTKKPVAGGALGALVQLRRPLALEFYLLRLALAPVAEIEKVRLRTWARMLGDTSPVPENTLSTAVTALESMQLVKKAGSGRKLEIHLLREDGSGKPYEEPDWEAKEQYFSLPHDYWTDLGTPSGRPLMTALHVPGTAMLLALLSATQGQPFAEVTAAWASTAYGFSTSTVDRGYAELSINHLLLTHVQRKKAHGDVGVNGLLLIHHRALAHPYSTAHRDALRAQAKSSALAKKAKATKPAAKGGGDPGADTQQKP